jgi:hypothetical protein
MSEIIIKPPEQDAEKPAEPQQSEPPHQKPEHSHPHRHGHVAIRPAESGVTHLDPGVVSF